jgi:glycosyltransferase involved in cell wall biosynthesis
VNILIVNYEFPPLGGGGGVACYHIARELAKTHSVDYLTTGHKGLPKFEVVDGINVYRVPVLGRKELSTATLLSMLTFLPSSMAKGIKLCKSNQYDVINTHFVIPSGPTGMFLSKLFKIPIVMSIHGGDIYDPSKKWSPHKHFLLRKVISFLLNHSDKIIAQSSNTKNNASKYYQLHKEITIIPLGFVTPEYIKSTRKDLNLSEEDIILISVGRLVKRKGYEYAIRAISKLHFKNIKYLIIGDGPEENNLKSLAKSLDVEDKVDFLGFVSEDKKFQYLSISDIYVLSSLHEGFGICLLEAMYCGLPIVSTDNGGQTDFLIDGVNALMVPVEDSDALAEQIKILIDNESLRLQMIEKNKKDITRFYIESIVKEYERSFGDVRI